MESLNRILLAGMVAAGASACSPSPLDQGEPNAARPGAEPAPAGAGAAAGGDPLIPQYRRSATPPGGVELDTGLKGNVRMRGGCVTVVDDSGQAVLPIFPAGARWTVPGKEIQVGDLIVRDGQAVVWSVQETGRDFRQGRPPREGEQDVPAHCAAGRYVRVLL